MNEFLTFNRVVRMPSWISHPECKAIMIYVMVALVMVIVAIKLNLLVCNSIYETERDYRERAEGAGKE